MQVIVEGTVVDIDLPNRQVKLREVIDEVEDFLFSVGKVPVGLSINGKSLTQQQLDARLDTVVSGTEKLEFAVEGVMSFIAAGMDTAIGANKQLLVNLRQFASDIHKANRSLDPKGLVDELQQFFAYWIQISQLIPQQFEGIDLNGREINPFLSDIRNLLEEVVKALEDSDPVLAADLLEFEVVPRIEKLDKALPILRDKVRALQAESEAKVAAGEGA